VRFGNYDPVRHISDHVARHDVRLRIYQDHSEVAAAGELVCKDAISIGSIERDAAQVPAVVDRVLGDAVRGRVADDDAAVGGDEVRSTVVGEPVLSDQIVGRAVLETNPGLVVFDDRVPARDVAVGSAQQHAVERVPGERVVDDLVRGTSTRMRLRPDPGPWTHMPGQVFQDRCRRSSS
jgi:hypothetical protein